MPPQISMVRFNILVVDDDYTSLKIVSSMIRSWKYEVTTVNSPFDALATVGTQNIDLVVTDLHMPKMNGIQLQKQIEAEYKLPVMIISSDDNKSLIMKSLSNGAVFYIVKPVNRDDFKDIWQYVVASKKEKFLTIERIGSLQRQGGSLPITGKTYYHDKSNSASSTDEGKHENKKDGKRKSDKKSIKEDVVGENSIAPKKAKVVWTNSLHNRFLLAIRHITLEKAVPKNILAFMNVPELTRENVASHLQKYRIFLKRVAEKGFATAYKNSMSIDRTFQSSFAAGHSSLLFKTSQDAYSQFKELEKQTSTTPFQSDFQLTNFGSMGGSIQARGHKPMLGSTNPFYQQNCTSFGLRPNDIETNISSRGTMSGTNSMQMPSLYRKIATPSVKEFGTFGIWNPSYGTPGKNNESTRTENVSFSNPNSSMKYFKNNNNNYAQIQINNDREFLAMGGQMIINVDGINDVGFSLINGTDQTHGLNVGDSTFGTCLAPGEYSSTGFNHVNQQFPPQVSGVNEQRSTSAVPPMVPQQQFGLSNSEQNDFLFDLMNDNSNIASVFDNIVDPQTLSELTDLLTNEPTNYQLPYQQQDGKGARNPNFASNSSYPAEMNPLTSQSLNDLDFSISLNVEDNSPWNEPSLEQLQEISELFSLELDNNNANPSNDYYPLLDENPNQQQGCNDNLSSELNGLSLAKNARSENQSWDDNFLDSLLRDHP